LEFLLLLKFPDPVNQPSTLILLSVIESPQGDPAVLSLIAFING